MRILSVHHGFSADHSSSTYEFFALKPLTPEQRAAVQALTGESGRRHLSFHYRGDRHIPYEWPQQLLTSGYDIMISESYDWWSAYLALPHDPTLLERLEPYQCDGDGNGLRVEVHGERLILDFGMHLDYDAVYRAFGEDPFEGLADLFEHVREELPAGDMSAAWAFYQTYDGGAEDEPEPVEPLSPSGKTLLRILGRH